jgi:hypothetical protein
MGRSVIRTYIGAYIKVDVPSKEFHAWMDKVNFDNDYDPSDEDSAQSADCNYNHFLRPYEGLESFSILIPEETKVFGLVNVAEDDENEIELSEMITQSNELKQFLIDDYAKAIEFLKESFGENVRVTFGVVNYCDEVA